jgi:predicted Zn-dependent protease
MAANGGFRARRWGALAVAALLAGCTAVRTTAPGTVGVERRTIMLVSSSQMTEAAKQSYGQVIGQARAQGRLNRDPVMARRVRTIGERLVPPTAVFRSDALAWEWEFNVIHENTLNAWCMPGGKIAFYSGIIKRLKLDDDEIAAIMGHEIAHALREHGRERVSNHMMAKFGLNALQLTGYSPLPPNEMGQLVQMAWLLPNSRGQETESDRIGVELAARAGYDPRAAVRVWEKMRALSGGGGPEFMSTHPSHETRIADLQDYSQRVMHLYQPR